MSLLVVCGLKAEAAIAAGPGVRVIVGGGLSDALHARLAAALGEGRPDAVLSFGVAGALAPGLSRGEMVVAEAVVHPKGAFDTDPPWREALARKLKCREAVLV
ncbi:MAG: hypothetical protein JO290_07480, partial [Sphingomonadaceae bacterium]|nr:hypothetical protein [Sphingomonadaceae bacterium]